LVKLRRLDGLLLLGLVEKSQSSRSGGTGHDEESY
jgi:hypothetical protein